MIDITALPFADQPHRYAGATCGHLAQQLIEVHPRGNEATETEIADIIKALSGNLPDKMHYDIGGRIGGDIGTLGTWICVKTDKEKNCIYTLSPFYAGLIAPGPTPEDTTVLERLRIDLERRAEQHYEQTGEKVKIPRLLRREDDAFTRYDKIIYEAPGGEDSFSGNFSHIPLPATHSISTNNALKRAFEQIVLHRRHWAEIEFRIKANADRARARFEKIGASISRTHLINVEQDADHKLSSISTVTALHVLGDTLSPYTVMLTLRNPPRVDPGEIDGMRVHTRDHNRRMKILAGREPSDAITVCPVIYRNINTLRPMQKALLRQALMKVAGLQKFGPEDEEMEKIVRGLDIKDGHIVGTVDMPRGAWRNKTLQVPGMTLPHTVLDALVDRPFSAVIEDERLEGFVIARASCDAKGRLNVVKQEGCGIAFKDVTAACE